MNVPIPPTIPGNENLNSLYTNKIKSNEIMLNKDLLAIDCHSSDTFVTITKSQGTVQVTVTADIAERHSTAACPLLRRRSQSDFHSCPRVEYPSPA